MKCFFLLANIISNYYNYIIIFTQEWRGGTSFLAGKTAGNTLRPFTSQFNREREGRIDSCALIKKAPSLLLLSKVFNRKMLSRWETHLVTGWPSSNFFFFLANGVKEENG
jgi:hypothetical protein